MYGKLSGMTGTAIPKPTNSSRSTGLKRSSSHQQADGAQDINDLVSSDRQGKYNAIIADIRDHCHKRGQPVLVGTTSIENSEICPAADQEKLPHQVLNAKQHARGSRDRRAGRRPGRDHHRHQHGRSRYRHRARRQRRKGIISVLKDDENAAGRRAKRPIAAARGRWQQAAPRYRHRRRRPAHHRFPSATNRAASTTSCAAVPVARATRGPRVSTCRSTIRCLRIFAGERLKAIMERLKMPEGEAIEHPLGHALAPSNRRSARSKPQLRHPQAAARIRRRRQRPAQGHLPAAQRTARNRRYLETITAMRQGVHSRHAFRARAGRRRGTVGPGGLSNGTRGDLQVLSVPVQEWFEERADLR